MKKKTVLNTCIRILPGSPIYMTKIYLTGSSLSLSRFAFGGNTVADQVIYICTLFKNFVEEWGTLWNWFKPSFGSFGCSKIQSYLGLCRKFWMCNKCTFAKSCCVRRIWATWQRFAIVLTWEETWVYGYDSRPKSHSKPKKWHNRNRKSKFLLSWIIRKLFTARYADWF